MFFIVSGRESWKKPLWRQFKNPVSLHSVINQPTGGLSHCTVAMDTGVLPWRRYYRQLQFDGRMKKCVKQQNILLITSERKRTTAETEREAPQGSCSGPSFTCSGGFTDERPSTLSESSTLKLLLGGKVEITSDRSSAQHSVQTDLCLSVGWRWFKRKL